MHRFFLQNKNYQKYRELIDIATTKHHETIQKYVQETLKLEHRYIDEMSLLKQDDLYKKFNNFRNNNIIPKGINYNQYIINAINTKGDIYYGNKTFKLMIKKNKPLQIYNNRYLFLMNSEITYNNENENYIYNLQVKDHTSFLDLSDDHNNKHFIIRPYSLWKINNFNTLNTFHAEFIKNDFNDVSRHVLEFV